MGLLNSPKNILAIRIKKATLLPGQLPEFNRKSSLEDLRIIQSARKELEDATTGIYRNIPIDTCQELFHYAIDMYSRIGDWKNAERKAKELVEYSQNIFFDYEVNIDLRVDAITKAARDRFGSDNVAADLFIEHQDKFLKQLGQYDVDISSLAFFGPGVHGLMLKYLAVATNKYGDICRHNGKYKKSAVMREKSLRIRIELGDPQLIIIGLINLGHLYLESGAIDDSAVIYEKALEIQEGSKSIVEEIIQEHIETTEQIASILDNLSIVYASQSKILKAKELLLKVLKTREIYYGLNDPDVGHTLIKLSNVTHRDNSLQESEQYAQRALEILKGNYGEEHPRTLSAYVRLGEVYFSSERFVEAEDCYLRCLRSHEEQKSISLFTIDVLAALGKLYNFQGRIEELIEKYERFISIAQDSTNDPYFPIFLFNEIARLLNMQGQHDVAYSVIIKARQIVLGSINELVDGSLISQTYTNLIEILGTDEVNRRVIFLEEAKTLLEAKSAYLPPVLAIGDSFALSNATEQIIEKAQSVGYPHDPSELQSLFEGLLEKKSATRPRAILNDIQEILNILRKHFYHSEVNFLAWIKTCHLARLIRHGVKEKMNGAMRDVVDFPDEMGTDLLTTVTECLRELETVFTEYPFIVEVTRLSIVATNQVQSSWSAWLTRPKKSRTTRTAVREGYYRIDRRPDELKSVQIELNDEDEKEFILPDVKEIIAQIDEKIRYERLTIPEFKEYCFFTEREPDRVKEIFSLLDSDIPPWESQRLALELLKIREQYLSKNSIRYATTLHYVSHKCYFSEGWGEDTIRLLEEAAARIAALKNQPPELAQFTLEKAAEVAEEIELYDRAISNLEKMVQLYEEDKSLPITYSFDAIYKKISILMKQKRYDDLIKLMPEIESFIRKYCPPSYLSQLVKWEGLFAKPLANSIYERYGVSGILLYYFPFFVHNVYLRLVCLSSSVQFYMRSLQKIFSNVWYFVMDILFRILQVILFIPAVIAYCIDRVSRR